MSESIKAMLPTITFRPSGAEQFHALLTLMVGTQVEITFAKNYPRASWDGSWHKDRWEIENTRGEIVWVTEHEIYLTPYGVPSRYKSGQYRDIVVIMDNVKMIEVIG